MAGNVYEWCADEWDENFYSRSPKSNPICSDGKYHIVRGGSWYSSSIRVRCGFRDVNDAGGLDGGFRVAFASGFSRF